MTIEYPQKPKPPSILTRLVSALSDDELRSIPALRIEHAAAMEKYRGEMAEYNAAQSLKVEVLHEQCERDFNMKGHPKAAALWAKAWDEGHSSGLQEVYNAYADLVDLVR